MTKTKLESVMNGDRNSTFYAQPTQSEISGFLKLSNGNIQIWATSDIMLGEFKPIE